MLKIFSTKAAILVLILFTVATTKMVIAKEHCKAVDFSETRVRPIGIVPSTHHLLTVSGTKSNKNMLVKLTLADYDGPKPPPTKLEYQGIKVEECFYGRDFPATKQYKAIILLDASQRGTKGIEVIGISKREKIEI